MNEKVSASLKSSDTEDWVDYHIVRPFSYLWACAFAKFGVHPNTVTVLSMIVGAVSAVYFVHGCFYYEGTEGLMANLMGLLLLFVADVLDNTDGQLARMTGKKSRLGRILDGVAGVFWYVPIYLSFVIRFYYHHELEFGWLGISDTPTNACIATLVVLALGCLSGFWALAGQQRLADYYIQTHLFFLKGERGSELDNAAAQQKLYDETPWKGNLLWKVFLRSYITYTKKQECVTPQFQRLMSALRSKFGATENFPASVREQFLVESKRTMPYVFMLVFNFRTAYLILFCLLDVPSLIFVTEVVLMSLVHLYVNRRHEGFCKRIADSL